MYLHFFNPGYEVSVSLNKTNYTPPANVQRMQRELALLPLWYADKKDYVWVEEMPDREGFQLPEGMPRWITREMWERGAEYIPELIAAPWGLSPQIVQFYKELRQTSVDRQLIVPEWKPEYRQLTSRETAARCLQQIKEKLPGLSLPDAPLFFFSLQDIEKHITHHQPPFVIKTPYSSSGRGILWIYSHTLTDKERQWIAGALSKQQHVSIEKGLEKVMDFAMEFHIDKAGKATYQGLSLFSAPNGSYNGNILDSQFHLEGRINSFISQLPYASQNEHVWSNLKCQLTSSVEYLYGGYYSGYLGVDMMIYRTADGDLAVHPCVEINMRYTMGMVAIRLFEQYIHPEASGQFIITYEKDAYQNHLQMQASHPPLFKNNQLYKGYISLCPVTPSTYYRAYVLIK